MYFDAFRVFAVVCVAHLAWPSGSISAQSALAGDTLELSLSAARSLAAEANPELLVAACTGRRSRGAHCSIQSGPVVREPLAERRNDQSL